MGYSTEAFFDYLYDLKRDKETLLSCSKEELKGLMEEKRLKLLEILKINVLSKMQQNISVIKKSVTNLENYSITEYDVIFLPMLTAPVWVLEPKVWNGRNMLYCHGHDSYGAKGSFCDYGQENPYHKWLPIQMVNQGFRVVIPEFIGFGDRKKEDHIQEGERGCYANTELLLMHGLNMAGVRVFEAMTMLTIMLDHWEMEDISVFGTSGGGLVACFLSAIDHRMNAIIISNYGASFKSSIMAMHHCVDNYIPNILTVGECSEILSLVAPTPILISNGIEDRIFPIEGTNETIKELKLILDRLSLSDILHIELFQGGHEISSKKIFKFLEIVK
jgi:hypothetical protein